jgi:hypothetical protein
VTPKAEILACFVQRRALGLLDRATKGIEDRDSARLHMLPLSGGIPTTGMPLGRQRARRSEVPSGSRQRIDRPHRPAPRCRPELLPVSGAAELLRRSACHTRSERRSHHRQRPSEERGSGLVRALAQLATWIVKAADAIDESGSAAFGRKWDSPHVNPTLITSTYFPRMQYEIETDPRYHRNRIMTAFCDFVLIYAAAFYLLMRILSN